MTYINNNIIDYYFDLTESNKFARCKICTGKLIYVDKKNSAILLHLVQSHPHEFINLRNSIKKIEKPTQLELNMEIESIYNSMLNCDQNIRYCDTESNVTSTSSNSVEKQSILGCIKTEPYDLLAGDEAKANNIDLRNVKYKTELINFVSKNKKHVNTNCNEFNYLNKTNIHTSIGILNTPQLIHLDGSLQNSSAININLDKSINVDQESSTQFVNKEYKVIFRYKQLPDIIKDKLQEKLQDITESLDCDLLIIAKPLSEIFTNIEAPSPNISETGINSDLFTEQIVKRKKIKSKGIINFSKAKKPRIENKNLQISNLSQDAQPNELANNVDIQQSNSDSKLLGHKRLRKTLNIVNDLPLDKLGNRIDYENLLESLEAELDNLNNSQDYNEKNKYNYSNCQEFNAKKRLIKSTFSVDSGNSKKNKILCFDETNVIGEYNSMPDLVKNSLQMSFNIDEAFLPNLEDSWHQSSAPIGNAAQINVENISRIINENRNNVKPQTGATKFMSNNENNRVQQSIAEYNRSIVENNMMLNSFNINYKRKKMYKQSNRQYYKWSQELSEIVIKTFYKYIEDETIHLPGKKEIMDLIEQYPTLPNWKTVKTKIYNTKLSNKRLLDYQKLRLNSTYVL